ncbi:MAG: TldD/PmbA family protein [Bryobacterales bacterium]|nr:TldD/PmbA family protein [Bryobacterales bacterium]
MLTGERARQLLDVALSESRRLGCSDIELTLVGHSEALTRFANNAIHQNVAERSVDVSVRAQIGLRTARATTTRLDEQAICAAVGDAVAMCKAQEENPKLVEMAGPERITDVNRWAAGTANTTPIDRARSVKEAIEIAREQQQTAAGIFSTSEWHELLLNSRGVFTEHRQTGATFSITTMAEDSSGWAKQSAVDRDDIDPAALARQSVRKAAASRNPRELEPGCYTVILEPAAVLDLVGQMVPDFSATSIEDQRSFLCERLGDKLFGSNITITDDVFHPLQSGAPFDGEGVARRRLTLVDKGIPAEVAYSRATAARQGKAPTGHGFPLPNEGGECPTNIVIAGGDTSVDEMIAGTGRGILVTRLWYIREVDPYEKMMTGMTRDGTFLVENGEIVCGVRNFRFNQGLIELLNNVEQLGPAVRASGEETFDMVVPAMKVGRFTFSEVTRF